jgi:formiminoglutamase
MLHHWVRKSKKNIETAEYELGSQIRFYAEKESDWTNVKVALLGIDEDADIIRQFLYTYSAFHEGNEKIIDLGNIRKKNIDFVIPLLNELLQSGVVPIILGGNENNIIAQFQAYKSLKMKINMAVIDEKIRLSLSSSSDSYLNQILEGENKGDLLHLMHIGVQGHLTDHNVLTYFEMKQFDAIRLGQIKNQIEEIEPFIRDADLLSFHLSALKQSEAPAQCSPSPSGLYIEESCRLMRYAGMSDKLSSMSIVGYDLKKDRDNQTAQAIAQLVWYFCDGFLNRKQDYPVSTDGLVEYIVENKQNESQLVFWRSTKTGRWWLQIPIGKNKQNPRHQLVPCSYGDYSAACNGGLPERLVNAIQRLH